MFIVRNEWLFHLSQLKSVQLHFNQNKWGWLLPNQLFGLHLRWLFLNYVSTSTCNKTDSAWLVIITDWRSGLGLVAHKSSVVLSFKKNSISRTISLVTASTVSTHLASLVHYLYLDWKLVVQCCPVLASDNRIFSEVSTPASDQWVSQG